MEARSAIGPLLPALLLAALACTAAQGHGTDAGTPQVGAAVNGAANISADSSSPQVGALYSSSGLGNVTLNDTQDNNSSGNSSSSTGGALWSTTGGTPQQQQQQQQQQRNRFDPVRAARLATRYSTGSGIPNHLSGNSLGMDLGVALNGSGSGNSSDVGIGGAPPAPVPVRRRSASPLVDLYLVKSCVELAMAVDACATAAAAEESSAQQQGRDPQQRRCVVTLTCGADADYRCVDAYGAPMAMVYRGSGALVVKAGPLCVSAKPRIYGGWTERPFFSVGGGLASMTLQRLSIDGGGVRRGVSASRAALLSLVNTDIANCSAAYAGAALLSEGTPVSVSGGTLTGNAVVDATGAGYGAAFCILTGDAPPAPTLLRPNFVNIFNRASFVGNTAPTAGALFLWKSSSSGIRVSLSRVSFNGNTGGSCSSVAVDRSDASTSGATAGPIELSLSTVSFRGNSATNKSEALAVCGAAAKPFTPSAVTYNTATAAYLALPSASDEEFNDFLLSQSR